MTRERPKTLGLAGWSGSGKTTLARQLIPALTARGLRVSTIKHAHHSFDVDTPGKDSYEHRHAGAQEVLVSSAARWALMHENRGAAEPGLGELLAKLAPCDLVLVEGFKREGQDKLEVHRPSVGKPLLAAEDPHVVAVASDEPLPDLRVPRLDLNDVAAVADFVLAHTGLGDRRSGAA
jgi:molybdopterin-guanine dinucleotide biosynthesis protein B